MTELRNRINKDELKVRLTQEQFERVTFSFYIYVHIENTKELRDQLFIQWTELLVGITLLTGYFTPLALVILMPISINIILFHILIKFDDT